MQFITAKCVSVMFFTLFTCFASAQSQNQMPADFYNREVQTIFDSRCIACHSCFNAPCQLNLQNSEGFERGGNKFNVYNGTRLQSANPTRLWVDAHGVRGWREKGFFELNTSKKTEENLFFRMLKLRVDHPQTEVTKQVAESMVCPDSIAVFERLVKPNTELGMPYGLPALTSQQMLTMQKWIEAGAPAPTEKIKIPVNIQKQIKVWEKFLNGSKLEDKLVARYLYEHLFLAHIYFPEDKTRFFKLIRSREECRKDAAEIATRRPNDDPGVKTFFYCLKPFAGTVVKKTHIPYELNEAKLNRLKKIFYETHWKAGRAPSYEKSVAENPFLAFKDIPVRARYRFLLEDSQYHVATFIKGPVCNGSNAVNSIQEQFYVFFLNPESDNSVISKSYYDDISPLLMLPGVFGSDVEIHETPVFYKKLIDHREKYRKARLTTLKVLRPNGYVLNDIWNGDGHNPNAVLTVFRHDDNAVVTQGAQGDLSKTIFMLDYPLFERLVYNLVVNFDVFGNVSHQLLTRVYMDMIRMEAEELFLMFLPPEQRLALRRYWYRGFLAEAKMTYIFPTMGSSEPTGVKFNDDETDTKKQMVQKILFYRLNKKVRGLLDALNWKSFEVPDYMQNDLQLDDLTRHLREMASVVASDATPFARFFPDLALLKIQTAAGPRVFSIIHNKEHENISWIMAESLRMDPQADTLTLLEGYLGSYPNMIFEVKSEQLAKFVSDVKNLKSEKEYQKLVDKFGVRRSHPEFWKSYDELISEDRVHGGEEFGYLDLTRYSL